MVKLSTPTSWNKLENAKEKRMKAKRILSMLLVLCLLMVFFAGCSKLGASDEENMSAEDDTDWFHKISSEDLDGNKIDSARFAENTLTMFNVWATWCPPCISELPELQAINEIYADRGFEMVGVLQDGVFYGEVNEQVVASAKLLLADAGAGYLNILPDSTLDEKFISEMQFFPTSFFVDSEGRVVHVEVGAKSASDWEVVIDEVFESL